VYGSLDLCGILYMIRISYCALWYFWCLIHWLQLLWTHNFRSIVDVEQC